ncbi:tripartite tricarboxylate transporter substrate binding protein [Pseudomonas sp.]|uniref:Bug family tripartite tricarboxylate transporter substrate binding protein n=1 Tax=Pseudomonas sp. TaxID=306 RepID=UPI0026111093|nr:tripartite tricarboxylate transporter substrate-binding protein [Pseudomonas sp.]
MLCVTKRCALGLVALLVAGSLHAEPRRPECIAPSSPGGAFDLTCKLAQSGLKDIELLKAPMRVTYMPGGIGAVAYNTLVAQRPTDPGAIVAFSSGSLLNLAQGKFGRYNETDVRWLAAVGASYGVIAVRKDSPYQNLDDLIGALRENPAVTPLGAAGTVGSQHWMQAALLSREGGVDPRKLRYVGFDTNGDVFTALLGGHVGVISGDIAVAAPYVEAGDVRVLALLADERLEGKLSSFPTAKEQGYNVSWPVIRGFFMGPKVKEADFEWWRNSFETLMNTDEFVKLRDQREMYAFSMTGDELTQYVNNQVKEYKQLADEFGLIQ